MVHKRPPAGEALALKAPAGKAPAGKAASSEASGNSVAEQTLSENMKIAAHITKQCGIALRVVRPDENMLSLSVEFSLRSEASS